MGILWPLIFEDSNGEEAYPISQSVSYAKYISGHFSFFWTLAGGAEDEGGGQRHVPGQGGEGGRCRGVEGVTEGEHLECLDWYDVHKQQS